MIMNKELHPRSEVPQMCVSRKNGGRGLFGCKNSVKSKENGLGWYVKKQSRTITSCSQNKWNYSKQGCS